MHTDKLALSPDANSREICVCGYLALFTSVVNENKIHKKIIIRKMKLIKNKFADISFTHRN